VAEFDEKLNHILSNPDAMAQIMQLAQSLGSNSESQTIPSQQAEPNPTISTPAYTSVSQSSDPFSSLLGDPSLLLKLIPLMQELGGQRDSNARALLCALQPYLKPERQDKIERALQLAKLFRVGKKFLSEWER
jgi:hypothetical protein